MIGKMMRYIVQLLMIILLCSCRESEQERIIRLVKEWNGKMIQFPDSICFTSYGNDTIMTKCGRKPSDYTILNYVDTIGCLSCRLQLPRWKDLIEEMDSVCPGKVNCMMVFYTNKKKQLIQLLKNNRFDDFVYMDDKDTLNRMNKLVNEENFRTLLLDKNDKVVAIGSPVFSPKIKELYLNIISGKTVMSSKEKVTLTDISLSKDRIDLGAFFWKEEREVEFIISNIGKAPLVINDVITTCGCIKVDFIKRPIPVGDSTTLKIHYKAERPEHFDKTIKVYCNVRNSPLELKISGNAK